MATNKSMCHSLSRHPDWKSVPPCYRKLIEGSRKAFEKHRKAVILAEKEAQLHNLYTAFRECWLAQKNMQPLLKLPMVMERPEVKSLLYNEELGRLTYEHLSGVKKLMPTIEIGFGRQLAESYRGALASCLSTPKVRKRLDGWDEDAAKNSSVTFSDGM